MEAKIIFADVKLREAFESLEHSDKKLERAFKEISEDVYCGRNVRKRLIPRKFIQEYNFNNLWIYDLRSGWRLLYSVTNDDITVLALILDWMNHKDYARLFRFN